jgi:hypothetical protein
MMPAGVGSTTKAPGELPTLPRKSPHDTGDKGEDGLNGLSRTPSE